MALGAFQCTLNIFYNHICHKHTTTTPEEAFYHNTYKKSCNSYYHYLNLRNYSNWSEHQIIVSFFFFFFVVFFFLFCLGLDGVWALLSPIYI